MGVITYFLLAGYRPFDRENQQLETQAIIAGDYKFGPGMFRYGPPQPYLTLGRTEGHWANVSQAAKEFVSMCLTVDPTQRPTASEVLKHRWLAEEKPHHVPDRMPIQNRVDARTRCEYPIVLFLNTFPLSPPCRIVYYRNKTHVDASVACWPGTPSGADCATSGWLVPRSKRAQDRPFPARLLESVYIDRIDRYSAEPRDMRTSSR
jgi:serine/threonine protein kinase